MVQKITQQEFEAVLQKKVALIDFSATWCGPCKMLAPLLDEASTELAGKVDFYAVDVDESPVLAGQFGIQSIPALVILKEGKLVDMQVGFVPKEQLMAFIQKQLG